MSLRELYWNRLLIAKNHAPGAAWVVGRVVRQDGDVSPEYTEVYLKKFADWIVNETTFGDLSPDEFRNLLASQKAVDPPTVQEPRTNPTAPHLCLNRDKNSQYYFATQPIGLNPVSKTLC